MAKTQLHLKLQSYLNEGLKELEIPGIPQTLYDPYRYALDVGGKRIRPLLTLLASGICGGEIKNALPAALAIEILHNFTLVHDDIMDRADTRRGKPSVFKKWDENTAILSGDVMFADAYRQLHFYGTNDEFSKSEYAAIMNSFTEASITVCEGQALDMEFVNRTDVTHQEYIEMIKGKTSALLAASLTMGAVSAHANSDQVENLHLLGIEMGIAFQIQDDLLDAIADPEKFGKRPGGDIYEGKKTYLTILALERADEDQKLFISNTLADENPTGTDVDEVLQLMKQLDVISDIKDEVNQHYSVALNQLDKFKDSEYKHELQNLLIFLKNRDH